MTEISARYYTSCKKTEDKSIFLLNVTNGLGAIWHIHFGFDDIHLTDVFASFGCLAHFEICPGP